MDPDPIQFGPWIWIGLRNADPDQAAYKLAPEAEIYYDQQNLPVRIKYMFM
jgi:hypothetical protein